MTQNRNGTIEILRFIFIWVVVCYHATPMFSFSKFFTGGFMAVEFFFILSGFFMAAHADKKAPATQPGQDVFDFLKHKISGIYPAFLICFITAFIVRECFETTQISSRFLYRVIYSFGELGFLQMAGFPAYCATGVGWYLSALFLSMLLLYPLLRKYESAFIFIVAPLLSIFLIGFMVRTTGNVNVPDYLYFGVVYKGMLRGVADICLGCMGFYLCRYWKNLSWTRAGKRALTFVEVFCYAAGLFMIAASHVRPFSVFVVVLFTLGSAATMSGKTLLAGKLDGKISLFLGELSVAVFFSHFYWVGILQRDGGTWPWQMRFAVYLLLTVTTSVFNWLLLMWWKKNGVQVKARLKQRWFAGNESLSVPETSAD